MNTIYIPPRGELRKMPVRNLDTLYWKLFSRWTRLKHADPQTGYVRCFTCGKIDHWQFMDCSHYIKRGNQCTRYSELNNHPCCRNCNRNLDGNLEKYAENLDQTYGKGTAQKLEHLGRQTCKVQRCDYVDGILRIQKKLSNYE